MLERGGLFNGFTSRYVRSWVWKGSTWLTSKKIRPGSGLSFCSHCLVRDAVHSRCSISAQVYLGVEALELDCLDSVPDSSASLYLSFLVRKMGLTSGPCLKFCHSTPEFSGQCLAWNSVESTLIICSLNKWVSWGQILGGFYKPATVGSFCIRGFPSFNK